MIDISSPRGRLVAQIVGLALVAVFGAVCGVLLARYGPALTAPIEDLAALLISIILLASTVVAMIMVAARPATVPRGIAVFQISSMALAGVLFGMPVLLDQLVPAETLFDVILLLMAVQAVINAVIWLRADEMLRRVMWEACALTFWVAQLGLFIYAAAERLGLVPSVSAWLLMSALMAVYLLASVVASARRGLS